MNTMVDILKYSEHLILHVYLQKMYYNNHNCMELKVVQIVVQTQIKKSLHCHRSQH